MKLTGGTGRPGLLCVLIGHVPDENGACTRPGCKRIETHKKEHHS